MLHNNTWFLTLTPAVEKWFPRAWIRPTRRHTYESFTDRFCSLFARKTWVLVVRTDRLAGALWNSCIELPTKHSCHRAQLFVEFAIFVSSVQFDDFERTFIGPSSHVMKSCPWDDRTVAVSIFANWSRIGSWNDASSLQVQTPRSCRVHNEQVTVGSLCR